MRCEANRSKAFVRDNLHNSPIALLLEIELLETQTDNMLMP